MNDGQCKWTEKELAEQIPKYLNDPVDFNGNKVKFYLILKWIKNNKRGTNMNALKEIGVNYVESIEQLPEEAGIYVTGYDADIEELEKAKKSGIPIIERPCPWVRQLRDQIMDVNADTHQCIIMIDTDHMVYDCYKSAMPEDTIVVDPNNYKTKISEKKNKKPINLLVYATFRKQDAERVIDYIKSNYDHQDNILHSYQKTLCCWTKQGLLEEVEIEVRNQNLEQIWVICSSEHDRSTISILSQIKEAGAKPVIIKEINDIPDKIDGNLRIGVLFAPIPLSTNAKNIKNKIRERFCN
jgi:4-hydroxy-3-methylbut-2-enyl diphosphate reductase IspH